MGFVGVNPDQNAMHFASAEGNFVITKFGFKEAAKAIADFPAIGRPSGYKDTRIKIVRDYLMVYKVLDTSIVIITIWDGRQHPLKLEKLLQ
jgi:ParE toxin of type II toxin-antitoxin system, parDE